MDNKIYRLDGRFSVDGRDREYTILESIAYERCADEKTWRVYGRVPVGCQIGGSGRA